MTTEERLDDATEKIVAMIDMYGKEKFAQTLIRYYGLRSLIDGGDLNELNKMIINTH